MKNRTIALVSLAVIFLSGCASAPTPQTPQEHRDAVAKGIFGAQYESLEVRRSYTEVALLVAKRANECLNVELIQQTCRRSGFVGASCNERSQGYTPTIVEGAGRTEIHVQMKQSGSGGGAGFLGGPPPPGGPYVVVADVVPLENGKATKIEIYGNQVLRAIPEAIKHWSNGTNLGCPDFSKMTGLPGPGRGKPQDGGSKDKK